MTRSPSAFEASFTEALRTYNALQPAGIAFESEQHQRLALQAGQLVAAYDVMVDRDLDPQIAIARTEPLPPKRQPRGVGPCIDPLVTKPELHNQTYVTLFSKAIALSGYLHTTNALRAAITNKTALELVPEATPRNMIASTAEIQAVIGRWPLPKKHRGYAGRDERNVRSGAFGRHHKLERATLDFYPAIPADPSREGSTFQPAYTQSGYSQLYTGHKVVPVFGMLHIVSSLE